MLYPYYWPLYKAGGPVQSLFNLAHACQKFAQFVFLSKSTDIDGSSPLHSLLINRWQRGLHQEEILYLKKISAFSILRAIRDSKPDLIYVNGIFHWHTSLIGLLLARIHGSKVVISPRGMLQSWALERGRYKKLLYIFIFKLLVRKNDIWHATDEQEKFDIQRVFGGRVSTFLAPNIPRGISKSVPLELDKTSQKIKLVFLSLINANKNLHLVIDAVSRLSEKFSLDIFGPIIDEQYWKNCLNRMGKAGNISYKGAVPPWEVSTVLSQYHFFILPTQGENFGHAIFDALASGVPVIVSKNCPWRDLENQRAGFYIEDLNSTGVQDALVKAHSLTEMQYHEIRQSSASYAAQYISSRDYLTEYSFLLN